MTIQSPERAALTALWMVVKCEKLTWRLVTSSTRACAGAAASRVSAEAASSSHRRDELRDIEMGPSPGVCGRDTTARTRAEADRCDVRTIRVGQISSPVFDLQAHSTRSDGTLEPAAVVAAAACVPRSAAGVAAAIEAIHAAGGVAVWAHPFWDLSDSGAVLAALERFVALGLDGGEVFYPTDDEAQVALLAERCARDGLLQTL